jgi:hypothetical protein
MVKDIKTQKKLLNDLNKNLLLFRRNCCVDKIDVNKVWIIDANEHRSINIVLRLISDCI